MNKLFYTGLTALLLHSSALAQKNYLAESKKEKDQRMQWWREARFGMFIHWGLYSIPAGEWKNETGHAEWIRTTAQIPLKEYDKFLDQFNPVNFNAEQWVQMAKDAGMKYITITSKHHDGFCLWDSKQTDFDVMSTPFKRDILKELAEACRKIGGVKLCFYHSIMDWHHPDYNQRREWEKDRPVEGTDRKRFISYLKNQLKELVTNYGDIGVIWFDGEWENFWTHADGKDLYNYVRSLDPGIIINNRVDKGRSGMAGMTTSGDYAGDFGTPEQEIPETGLPGVDWESCMTMNNNWGFNKNDQNFKSSKDLIRKLADIASKGGNFLLNIGPKADGTFPRESIDRLKDIGQWMKTNGESIYGTEASPFEDISWGRVTQKRMGNDTRLYLHVFDWPKNGEIPLHGIENEILKVYMLADNSTVLSSKGTNELSLKLPVKMPDEFNTVVVVDIKGKPFIHKNPFVSSYSDQFTRSMLVTIEKNSDSKEVVTRYTTNGIDPDARSMIYPGKIILNKTSTLKARNFLGSRPVSAVIEKRFEKIAAAASMKVPNAQPGLEATYFSGEWSKLPVFDTVVSVRTRLVNSVNPGPMAGQERYAIVFEGFIKIPADDVYAFYLSSDDGSRLLIDEKNIIDHDGLHSLTTKKGQVALAAGYHKIRVEFFERTGGDDLKLEIESTKIKKQPVKAAILFHGK